jgi:hypothetical protein
VELLREDFIRSIMPSSHHEHPDRREMRGCHVFPVAVGREAKDRSAGQASGYRIDGTNCGQQIGPAGSSNEK